MVLCGGGDQFSFNGGGKCGGGPAGGCECAFHAFLDADRLFQFDWNSYGLSQSHGDADFHEDWHGHVIINENCDALLDSYKVSHPDGI